MDKNGLKNLLHRALFVLFSAFMLTALLSALLQWQKRHISKVVGGVFRTWQRDVFRPIVEATVARALVEYAKEEEMESD